MSLHVFNLHTQPCVSIDMAVGLGSWISILRLSTVGLSSGQEVGHMPECAIVLTVKNLVEEKPLGSVHRAQSLPCMGIL